MWLDPQYALAFARRGTYWITHKVNMQRTRRLLMRILRSGLIRAMRTHFTCEVVHNMKVERTTKRSAISLCRLESAILKFRFVRAQILAETGNLDARVAAKPISASFPPPPLERDPDYLTGVLDNRITMWMGNGRYANALADLAERLRRQPDDAATLRKRGILLVGCPDRKLRDAKQAVADARRACELTKWQEAESLSALAAVYAELGNFDQAIKWQRKALSFATSEFERTDLEFYLESYKNHEPVEAEKKSVVPVRARR